MRHAEAADEVAEIVCKSLKVEQTEVPRKVARLHLVSDILHNSVRPAAIAVWAQLNIRHRLYPTSGNTVWPSSPAFRQFSPISPMCTKVSWRIQARSPPRYSEAKSALWCKYGRAGESSSFRSMCE